MPEIGEHIDWELSLRLAGGSPELAREMLDMLIGALPAQMRALEAAAADSDLGRVQDLAHVIRGAAAYCGVPRLQLAARVVEESVHTGDQALVAAEIGLLRRDAERLLQACRAGRFTRSPG